MSHRWAHRFLLIGIDFGGLPLRLAIHPLVEAGPFEAPAVAEFEGGHESFGGVLVESVGRDAKVIRRLANVHDFPDFRNEQVGTSRHVAHDYLRRMSLTSRARHR